MLYACLLELPINFGKEQMVMEKEKKMINWIGYFVCH